MLPKGLPRSDAPATSMALGVGAAAGCKGKAKEGLEEGPVAASCSPDVLLMQQLEIARKLVREKLGSCPDLSELDGDVCPTCLDPYTEENPKISTRCNHHFHLACIYEWLERSQTCPVCGRKMEFEELGL